MRLFFLILVYVVLIAPAAGYGEWYVAGYGGGVLPGHLTEVERSTRSPTVISLFRYPDLPLSAGPVGGIKLGYILPPSSRGFPANMMGLELELFYLRPVVQRFGGTGTRTDTTPDPSTRPSEWPSTTSAFPVQIARTPLNLLIATANIVARYPHERLQPYIGLGAGAAHAWANDAGLGQLSDTVRAIQGFLGLRWFLLSRLAALIEYKYLHLRAEPIEFASGASGVSAMHIGIIGLAWHF